MTLIVNRHYSDMKSAKSKSQFPTGKTTGKVIDTAPFMHNKMTQSALLIKKYTLQI